MSLVLIIDHRLLIGAVNKRTSTLDLKFFTNYSTAEGGNSEYTLYIADAYYWHCVSLALRMGTS